jgi:hypothetical protein
LQKRIISRPVTFTYTSISNGKISDLYSKSTYRFYTIIKLYPFAEKYNITHLLTLWNTLREERKLRVFENMVLRRIFGRRRDEVTGEWRRLHNEELNDPYCSPNIVRVIKSRTMRLAGHVVRMGKEMGGYRVLVGNRRERGHWGDLGVDG